MLVNITPILPLLQSLPLLIDKTSLDTKNSVNKDIIEFKGQHLLALRDVTSTIQETLAGIQAALSTTVADRIQSSTEDIKHSFSRVIPNHPYSSQPPPCTSPVIDEISSARKRRRINDENDPDRSSSSPNRGIVPEPFVRALSQLPQTPCPTLNPSSTLPASGQPPHQNSLTALKHVLDARISEARTSRSASLASSRHPGSFRTPASSTLPPKALRPSRSRQASQVATPNSAYNASTTPLVINQAPGSVNARLSTLTTAAPGATLAAPRSNRKIPLSLTLPLSDVSNHGPSLPQPRPSVPHGPRIEAPPLVRPPAPLFSIAPGAGVGSRLPPSRMPALTVTATPRKPALISLKERRATQGPIIGKRFLSIIDDEDEDDDLGFVSP